MTEPTSVQPKHTHYVSLENGCIHPAMTSPAGYEDEHTTEWRPATAGEIQRYVDGADRTEAYAPVPLQPDAERTAIATPTTLTLASDDETNAPVGVQIVNPSAQQIPAPPAPPVAPPPPPFTPDKG